MSRRNRGISIITCTNRPKFFDNILENYKRQLYPIKELIIVLNKNGMNLSDYRKKASKSPHVSVYKMPENVSLGACLNYAVKQTKYPYIAKFDDDDYYSRHYLSEQKKAMLRSKADVVGKRAFHVYLSRKRLLVLFLVKKQNKFVKWVTGGTLLVKKRVFHTVRFPNASLNEDLVFGKRCSAKSFKVYSSSPYNYVMVRRKNKTSHTWKVSDNYLLSGSSIVAKTNRYRKIATRAF